MPVELKNKIDLISPAFFGMLNDYMEYLVFKSQEKETVSIQPKKRNAFGILKGHKFYMSEDFNKSLDDFEEYY